MIEAGLTWEEAQATYATNTKIAKRNSQVRYTIKIADAFCRFVGVRGKVLDVGCGNGRYSGMTYEEAGVKYIDLVNNDVRGVDPITPNYETRFPVDIAKAESLPYADNSFDAVVFATSLDHMESPLSALREARRVVKDGGSVIIWNSVFVYGNAQFKDNRHLHMWDSNGLFKLIENAGLMVFIVAYGPTVAGFSSCFMECNKKTKTIEEV